MKANLMFADRDFDITAPSCYGKDTLMVDLELGRMIDIMAQGDKHILNSCEAAVFQPMYSLDEIAYRQEVLRDALRNRELVQQIYNTTIQVERQKDNSFFRLATYSDMSATFKNAIELLKLYTSALMELRHIADKKLSSFQSRGFRSLLTTIQKELDDAYFKRVRELLDELSDGETVISATLGPNLEGVSYMLHRKSKQGIFKRMQSAPTLTFKDDDPIADQDFTVRRDRAVNEASRALAHAARHLEQYFALVRNELAFYVGCMNLEYHLGVIGMKTVFPKLLSVDSREHAWKGLYDVSLVLSKKVRLVLNDLPDNSHSLYIITGANQGGFLRSVGQSQLLTQCGCFVCAEDFTVPLRSGIFTHFIKEEDQFMKSGKLDEELVRISEVIDYIKPGALVLFNESFASTNEREGSEILHQVTQALLESGVEVFSVSHLFAFANSYLGNPDTQYMRTERIEGGELAFRVVPGEPFEASFGQELYKKIFAE